MNLNKHFDSIGEAVAFSSMEGGPARQSRRSGKPEWAGTETFADACQLARDGWPEGARKIREAAAMVTANIPIPEAEVFAGTYFDVSGSYPDVERFCTGEPESMVEFTLVHKPLPVITITYQGGILSNIPGDAAISSGAGLGALVDKLEADGIRCQVVLLNYCKADGGGTCLISTTIKNPEDPLDLDRLAFAVCNPAMPRRIMFGVKENMGQAARDYFGFYATGSGFSSGYSSSTAVPAKFHGDIHVPGVTDPRFSLHDAARLVSGTVKEYTRQKEREGAQALDRIKSRYFGKK